MLQTLPSGLAVLVLAVTVPALGAMAWWSRRTPGSRARWATRGEVRPLAVPAPTPGRMTLGMSGRQLLAAEPQHSLIVFGPTGSGKTLSVVEPALPRIHRVTWWARCRAAVAPAPCASRRWARGSRRSAGFSEVLVVEAG